jgi:hypothetical protein
VPALLRITVLEAQTGPRPMRWPFFSNDPGNNVEMHLLVLIDGNQPHDRLGVAVSAISITPGQIRPESRVSLSVDQLSPSSCPALRSADTTDHGSAIGGHRRNSQHRPDHAIRPPETPGWVPLASGQPGPMLGSDQEITTSARSRDCGSGHDEMTP